MPDLIRHPEYTEIAGFQTQFIQDFERGRNDALKGSWTFYETINGDKKEIYGY